MALTFGEAETIQNIIRHLKARDCGCSHSAPFMSKEQIHALHVLHDMECEVASRIYLDTWIIPALEMLLPGDGRDVDTAVLLSR